MFSVRATKEVNGTRTDARGRWVYLGVAVAVLLVLAGSGNASPGQADARIAAADCTRATALRLVERHRLNAFLLANPIGQLLCGAFTGPGSRAMALTIRAPTCWGIQRWVVFRFDGSDWRLVLDRRAFVFPLVVVGTTIRETEPVFRQGDPRCLPSGGRRARTWRWNGTRLVAGPWRRVASGGATEAPVRNGHFKTPSGNIVCFHSPGPADMPRVFLGCGIKSGLKPPPPRRPCREGGYAGDRVELLATGRVHVPPCAGDPGALVGERSARVLGYGKTWSGGGIRCTSAVAGLTCRNRSGHGFFLSRERWRAF
jgi:hypothetical protein